MGTRRDLMARRKKHSRNLWLADERILFQGKSRYECNVQLLNACFVWAVGVYGCTDFASCNVCHRLRLSHWQSEECLIRWKMKVSTMRCKTCSPVHSNANLPRLIFCGFSICLMNVSEALRWILVALTSPSAISSDREVCGTCRHLCWKRAVEGLHDHWMAIRNQFGDRFQWINYTFIGW